MAAAHCNRDTANNIESNLAAFCQRYRMDGRRTRVSVGARSFAGKALSDLFAKPYEVR